MFCSQECQENAQTSSFYGEGISKQRDLIQRTLHESLVICGSSHDKLKQLMSDPELSNKTIFDFDFSDPDDPLYKFHQLVAFNGLQQGPASEQLGIFEHHPILQSLGRREMQVAKAYMKRAYLILRINSFSVEFRAPLKSPFNGVWDRDLMN
jgi:hypothetical protein